MDGEPNTASVLRHDLPWETHTIARLISDRDLQLIRKYDMRNRETQEELQEKVRPEVMCLEAAFSPSSVRYNLPDASIKLECMHRHCNSIWRVAKLWCGVMSGGVHENAQI